MLKRDTRYFIFSIINGIFPFSFFLQYTIFMYFFKKKISSRRKSFSSSRVRESEHLFLICLVVPPFARMELILFSSLYCREGLITPTLNFYFMVRTQPGTSFLLSSSGRSMTSHVMKTLVMKMMMLVIAEGLGTNSN
jgi:hypothetical protein